MTGPCTGLGCPCNEPEEPEVRESGPSIAVQPATIGDVLL